MAAATAGAGGERRGVEAAAPDERGLWRPMAAATGGAGGERRGVGDAAPYGGTVSRICHCEASAHTGTLAVAIRIPRPLRAGAGGAQGTSDARPYGRV